MASLSVGQVSALIAAGTAILQIILPLAITLVLIAYISTRNQRITATAATWSTLNRALHSSWWPTILQSDTAGTKHVAPCVSVATYFSLCIALLLAITAVVTPLGLYDAISTGNKASVVFGYSRDNSPFGYGTPPRSDLGFSRRCGDSYLMLCPGTNFTLQWGARPYTQMYVPDSYSTAIPPEHQRIWSSGLGSMAATVSSIFDIQWRSPNILQQNAAGKITIASGVEMNNGSAYLVGGYRNLHTVVLRNSTEAYEGLIVDTINGGVGFRNHTVPPPTAYGSTWTEDILFVQPETQCVDTNLTLDYILKQNNVSGELGIGDQVFLTDRGGFAALDAKYDWRQLKNIQDDPMLYSRAYTAAWLNNVLSMMFFNETNADAMESGITTQPSQHGRDFKLQDNGNSSQLSLTLGLRFSGKFDKITTSVLGAFLPLTVADSTLNSSSTSRLYPNPQRITEENFKQAAYACRGNVNATSAANINNLAVMCGLLYPPGRSPNRNLDPFDRGQAGEPLRQSIYSCASASKATIKTVTLSYNGTGGFEGLQVVEITNKGYGDASVKPLWGVENSGMNFSQISPLWGLVDSKYENDVNVSTFRGDSLWLPGFVEGVNLPINRFMNTPGAHFHSAAMRYVYASLGTIPSAPSNDILGYSGHAQFAMYRKWLELSTNARESAKIINLVWTDIVANAVVGTRGWASNEPAGKAVEVTYIRRRVHYKLVYAIPAFIMLAMTLGILVLTAVLIATRRTSLEKLKWLLDRTSLGRNFTSLLYPDVSSQQTTRKAWQDRDAQKTVTVTEERPCAGQDTIKLEEVHPKRVNSSGEDIESSERFLPT